MNAYQWFRETREDYVDNFLPRVSQDEMSPFLAGYTESAVYHYDRRHDIYDGLVSWAPDKAKTKLLVTAATTYARRQPGRLAAKVITRSIPYVGWALLFYDAYQLYQWYQD